MYFFALYRRRLCGRPSPSRPERDRDAETLAPFLLIPPHRLCCCPPSFMQDVFQDLLVFFPPIILLLSGALSAGYRTRCCSQRRELVLSAVTAAALLLPPLLRWFSLRGLWSLFYVSWCWLPVFPSPPPLFGGLGGGLASLQIHMCICVCACADGKMKRSFERKKVEGQKTCPPFIFFLPSISCKKLHNQNTRF